MIQIVEKKLPNGKVSYEKIGNGNVREAIMKLSENVVSLKSEVSALQKAVVELQRR